jgi:amidase
MPLSVSPEPASQKTEAFIEKVRVAAYQSGALTGLTFAVKDLIDIGGKDTGAGNPIWRESHPPAASHAVCVEQLLAEGAICLGKTITDELAFDLIGENHFYGTPMNTRAPERVPGGSSSGSASAVAAGYVDFALGTDTGGSVRVPASNCGLYGFRPSHSAISVAGVTPFAPSFDTVGVIASTAEALTKVGGVLLSASVPTAPPVKRFFVLKEAFEIVDLEVRNALERPMRDIISTLGLKQDELSLRRIDRKPTEGWFEDWLATYRTIQGAEVWSTLGAWIEWTKPVFGPRIAKNFDYSKATDRKKLGAAIRFRETLFRRCFELMDDGDLLCMPTVPAPAPLKGAIGNDRNTNEYILHTLSLTSVAGICRLPQVTIPVASIDKAPIGISLLGKYNCDTTVLGAAMVASKYAQKV